MFDGIRILDLTKVFGGPFATRQFADLGAEVVKIESLENPDDSRQFAPLKNGWSGYFELLNRNKKGIALNLKNPQHKERFFELIKTSDVFVENLSPQAKIKLGIEYEQVKKYNPQIIYASLSGVGQKSDRKYYDILAQAESGLMTLSGEAGMPYKIGPSVVDAFSGMTLAFAIAAALYEREKTKKGSYIDVSMLASSMNLLEQNVTEYSLTKKVPQPPGTQDTAIAPFGIYKTQDSHVVIACGNDKQWTQLHGYLKKTTNCPEELFASNEKRLAHLQELVIYIENVLREKSTAEVVQELQQLNIPCARVATVVRRVRQRQRDWQHQDSRPTRQADRPGGPYWRRSPSAHAVAARPTSNPFFPRFLPHLFSSFRLLLWSDQ
jgi:CoA:oxalate CoA-transferase